MRTITTELAVHRSMHGVQRNKDNGRCFLNLYYFHCLKQQLADDPCFGGANWIAEKNEIGGVWLSNYDKLPSAYAFREDIASLCKKHSARLWFHIELWDGVTASKTEDPAGRFQLRAQCDGDNKTFVAAFVNYYLSAGLQQESLYLPKRTNAHTSTFYCLAQRFERKHLAFGEMTRRLLEFMQLVGGFDKVG